MNLRMRFEELFDLRALVRREVVGVLPNHVQVPFNA
jgi:hypothetical protein